MPVVQISQAGQINTAAIVIPGVYPIIQLPNLQVVNGATTNVAGYVGVGSWGPLNVPIPGNVASLQQQFGPPQSRTYDLLTGVSVGQTAGGNIFVGVRVSDGTDVAASSPTAPYGGLSALFTGTVGNNIVMYYGPGAKAGTQRVVVQLQGVGTEVYDNIPLSSPLAQWTAFTNMVNTGQNTANQTPSRIIMATFTANAGLGYLGGYLPAMNGVAPVLTGTFSGGTDGATGATSQTLVGTPSPATGMYTLPAASVSVAALCDTYDRTTWSTQLAFGQQYGVYMCVSGPPGDTPIAAIAGKQAASADGYGLKVMHGDWLYWFDQYNSVNRLVSPASFVAGLLSNLSPEQSSLNKPIPGITGSQFLGLVSTGSVRSYDTATLQSLILAGIDLIAIGSVGGNYWSCQCGHNSSTNSSINGDAYTRLTNYFAITLDQASTLFEGEVINNAFFANVTASLSAQLLNDLNAGLLALQEDGSLPYTVVCNGTNNPAAAQGLGYARADVQIRYQGIAEKFLLNIQGGATEQVSLSQNS